MRHYLGTALLLCHFLACGLFGAVTLNISPSTISLAGTAGSTTPITNNSTSVSATGSGSGSLTLSTSPASSWLTASASSATITAGGPAVGIAVSVNPAGLTAGSRSGSVTIASGASLVTLNVSLILVAGLTVDRTSLTFNATTGSSSPPAQTLKITATDNSSVAITVSSTTSSGGS